MTRYLLLTIVFAVVLFAVSYKSSLALFTASAESSGNTFAAAATFPTTTTTITPTPTDGDDPAPTPGKIVINEVSPNGNTDIDWVEILNAGGTAVDVSGWTISDNNGSDTLPTVPTINPGEFAVIIASGSSVAVPETAKTITLSTTSIGGVGGLAASGDRVILLDGITNIDQMGYGSDTEIFPTPPNSPTSVQSIRRIPNGDDNDSAGNWQSGDPSIGVAN